MELVERDLNENPIDGHTIPFWDRVPIAGQMLPEVAISSRPRSSGMLEE